MRVLFLIRLHSFVLWCYSSWKQYRKAADESRDPNCQTAKLPRPGRHLEVLNCGAVKKGRAIYLCLIQSQIALIWRCQLFTGTYPWLYSAVRGRRADISLINGYLVISIPGFPYQDVHTKVCPTRPAVFVFWQQLGNAINKHKPKCRKYYTDNLH